VSVVCCQVEVSATGWSLVQRSPTECGVSKKFVIVKARKMRRPRPPRGCRAIGRKKVTIQVINRTLRHVSFVHLILAPLSGHVPRLWNIAVFKMAHQLEFDDRVIIIKTHCRGLETGYVFVIRRKEICFIKSYKTPTFVISLTYSAELSTLRQRQTETVKLSEH
jgi:hypothetical protein